MSTITICTECRGTGRTLDRTRPCENPICELGIIDNTPLPEDDAPGLWPADQDDARPAVRDSFDASLFRTEPSTRNTVDQIRASISAPRDYRPAPKRSLWPSVVTIGVAIGAALAMGLLAGCAEPSGPAYLPGSLTLPDGSELRAFTTAAPTDKWGMALASGQGIVQTKDGRSIVAAYSVAPGSSDAGIVAQLAVGAAGQIGGGAIGGYLTKQGLNGVASAIGNVNASPVINVPMPKIPLPGSQN